MLSNFTSATSLTCISMNNQACKIRLLLMLIVMDLYFILLVLKQVNVVVAVTIPMIHMQKMCVPGVVKNLEVEVFNLM